MRNNTERGREKEMPNNTHRETLHREREGEGGREREREKHAYREQLNDTPRRQTMGRSGAIYGARTSQSHLSSQT